MCPLGFAERERDAGHRVLEELGHAVAHPLEDVVAPLGAQDEQSEHKLQRETPEHRVPVDLVTRQVISKTARITNMWQQWHLQMLIS